MSVVQYIRNQCDRLGAWICIAAGVATLTIGYLGVSATLDTEEQVPYVVSGGMVGLFLLGIGALLWLFAGLRDEWRKLDAIEHHLTKTDGSDLRADPSATAPWSVSEQTGDLASLGPQGVSRSGRSMK